MHIVVIGSGIAGVTFAEEILKRRESTQVSLVTREAYGYYSRPLLSHGFTREDIEEKIIMKSFATLRSAGIEIAEATQVRQLDRNAKTLELERKDGRTTMDYDKVVIATGSAALIPPPFRTLQGSYRVLNSLDDLKRLRQLRNSLRDQGNQPFWAVIGGGLIGCEVASDLEAAGDRVHLFHAMPRLMERQLTEPDSIKLLAVLEKAGIEIHLNCSVSGFGSGENGMKVQYEGGEESGFDAVILACGFSPRIDLARAAGLDVNRGIVVNPWLTTSDPEIYAVGDVAECADGKIYAYVTPIRNQAIWLAEYLSGSKSDPWQPPFFKPKAKVHGFTADDPYLF